MVPIICFEKTRKSRCPRGKSVKGPGGVKKETPAFFFLSSSSFSNLFSANYIPGIEDCESWMAGPSPLMQVRNMRKVRYAQRARTMRRRR